MTEEEVPGHNKLTFHATRLAAYAISRLYFRIEFHGVERVPAEGPTIIAPNHASYIDPIWVSLPITRPLRYMAWDKMFAVPLVGFLMRAFGAFPVKETGSRTALRLSLEQLKKGGGLVIFPEGGRTRTGDILPFKPGFVRLALDTGACIVPVTIIGAYRAYSPWHKFPRPHKVKVIYHDPIRLEDLADPQELKQYMKEQCDRVQEIVAAPLPASERRNGIEIGHAAEG
jgi:1-acyl-sn-glycerol-3-phosphate acyltransferase